MATVADGVRTMPPLGSLEMDIHFPRPPGDPCNDRTLPFPVLREEIRDSKLDQVVTDESYPTKFIDNVVEAGQKLAERGCIGLITCCGFLAMAQSEISERLDIPIATSALIQIPSILAILPPKQSIGVITYDNSKLGVQHLSQLGIVDPSRVHMTGAPRQGALRKLIEQGGDYHFVEMRDELVKVTEDLIQEHPDIGTILLECTQMPPFAEAIQKAVKLPVYDVYTMALWFHSSLIRRSPESWPSVTKSYP